MDQRRRPGGLSAPAKYQLGVSFIGAAVILLVMAVPFGDSTRLPVPVEHWTLVHLARMAIAGLLGGALLAVAAWIRPIDQELFYPSVAFLRGSLPLGLILGVLGTLFLPLALVAYGLMAVRSHVIVSRSVLVLLTLAAALTFGFWIEAGQSLPMPPPRPSFCAATSSSSAPSPAGSSGTCSGRRGQRKRSRRPAAALRCYLLSVFSASKAEV